VEDAQCGTAILIKRPSKDGPRRGILQCGHPQVTIALSPSGQRCYSNLS
jgi:hypothetical protein